MELQCMLLSAFAPIRMWNVYRLSQYTHTEHLSLNTT